LERGAGETFSFTKGFSRVCFKKNSPLSQRKRGVYRLYGAANNIKVFWKGARGKAFRSQKVSPAYFFKKIFPKKEI
jgi:hypothetical protein